MLKVVFSKEMLVNRFSISRLEIKIFDLDLLPSLKNENES